MSADAKVDLSAARVGAAVRPPKRLNYESVRITCLSGTIELTPSANGWSASFAMCADSKKISYGKTITEAAQLLLKDLKHLVGAIEEDIEAFVARNQ